MDLARLKALVWHLALAAACIAPLGGLADAATLRLSHTNPPAGARHEASVLFASLVAKYTEGRHSVQIFHSSQLGNDPKGVEQVSLGAVDFVVTGPLTFATYSREIYILGLPYLVTSYEQGWKFYDQSAFIKRQNEALIAKGIRLIGNWEGGFRSYTSTFPINSVSDVKGKKVRLPPDETLRWMAEAQGWTPVLLPVNEVYLALQQGLVAAQENPVDTTNAQRFYEVAKYITLTRHIYSPQWIAISEKTWARLEPKDQEALVTAAKEAGTFIRKTVKDSEEQQLRDMEAKGAVVSRPDLAAWMKASESVYDRARQAYGEGPVNEIIAESKRVQGGN